MTTEATFLNTILESELKNFPKEIEVNIESSNNPHGDYELTVCDGENIIGKYWYDSKEDAENDGYKLEDFFDVTFI